MWLALHSDKRFFRLRMLLCILLCGMTMQSQGMEYMLQATHGLKTCISRNKLAFAITGTCALCAGTLCYFAKPAEPLRWAWGEGKYSDYQRPQKFPSDFLFGTATSAYQVEGDCTNNSWTIWERQAPHVEVPAGHACEHWARYKEDIQLMKSLGVNAYRFSIEWSKVEPAEGIFDEAALQHYEDVCQELDAHGIRPCITLHHYTDPIWFLEKMGFEQDENIAYYVEYAITVIKRLARFNPLWFTFNSPDGYAAQGYITCTKPAGRIPPERNWSLFAQVYKNLLEAHVRTYRAIKAELPSAQIGMLKNIFQLDPYYAWDRIACAMQQQLTDNGFFSFFTQGIFEICVPMVHLKHVNALARGALDFVGINYYSHGCMKNFHITTFADEVLTDNPRYTIYAEGLYRAIQQVSQQLAAPLSIPMYVTENGIATTDNAKRDLFLKKYLYALSKAINDGYDVKGYFHWSFMDNYEWGSFTPKYGVYEVDFATQERKLKPGSAFFIETIMKNKGL